MIGGCPAVIPVIETQKPHEKQLPPSGGLAGIEVALGGKTTYINIEVGIAAERANFPQGEDAKPPVPKGGQRSCRSGICVCPMPRGVGFFFGDSRKEQE